MGGEVRLGEHRNHGVTGVHCVTAHWCALRHCTLVCTASLHTGVHCVTAHCPSRAEWRGDESVRPGGRQAVLDVGLPVFQVDSRRYGPGWAETLKWGRHNARCWAQAL